MRSGRVVITSPFLDCATRMEDRWERMFVEEFVAEPTVEALDTAVLRRFSRIDKVLRDSSQSRPFEHLVAGTLAAVIRFQDFWKSCARNCTSRKYGRNASAVQRKVDFDCNAFS